MVGSACPAVLDTIITKDLLFQKHELPDIIVEWLDWDIHPETQVPSDETTTIK